MKNISIILILLLLTIPSYAGKSTNHAVSVEVFGGGGGDSNSTNFILHGKTRGTAYGIRTSTSHVIGEGFTHASFLGLNTNIFITSIAPNTSPNNVSVPVTINGGNFVSGLVVMLKRAGEAPITAEGVVVSSNQILGTFNIIGKTVGTWDLVVINPNSTSDTLYNGFTITLASSKLDIIGKPVNFPNPFDPSQGPTTIRFSLTKDAPIILNIYNIGGTRIWQKSYAAGSAGGKAGLNEVLWDGYTVFSELVPNGIYVYQIYSGGTTLATGKIAVFR